MVWPGVPKLLYTIVCVSVDVSVCLYCVDTTVSQVLSLNPTLAVLWLAVFNTRLMSCGQNVNPDLLNTHREINGCRGAVVPCSLSLSGSKSLLITIKSVFAI